MTMINLDITTMMIHMPTLCYLRMMMVLVVEVLQRYYLVILNKIYLINYNISGVLPKSIQNFSNLTHLILAKNHLKSPIPWPELISLQKLIRMTLEGNNFKGSISNSIGEMSPLLQHLRLDGNSFSSTKPPSIGNLHNIVYLTLGGNSLQSTIPEQLGEL